MVFFYRNPTSNCNRDDTRIVIKLDEYKNRNSHLVRRNNQRSSSSSIYKYPRIYNGKPNKNISNKIYSPPISSSSSSLFINN